MRKDKQSMYSLWVCLPLLLSCSTYACQENTTKVKSPWEKAKCRGVSYRATGNEPSWVMDIYLTDKVHFLTHYGQHEIWLTNLFIDENKSNKTTRIQSKDSSDFEIKIEEATCTDSMSGQQFSSSVTVTFKKALFRGCGKALD